MKKKLKVSKILLGIEITSLFLSSCLFVSCSKKKDAGIPALKFIDAITSNYSPITHIAAENKIADKYGVHPQIEFSDTIEPLLTGKADGRLNGLPPSVLNAANGADIFIFAGTMSGGHIIFANKKVAGELSDPRNYRGHSIGVRPQVTNQFVLPAALKEKFGYTEKDYTLKYYDSDNAALAACAKGDVDIAPVYYAERETALSLGLVQIAELVDLFPDYACCRQTANGQKLRSDRNLFVSWTKSLIVAWKVYVQNHDEALRVVQKITKQDENWAYDHIYNDEITAHISFHPDPDYNGVLAQYGIYKDLGYVSENPRPLVEFFDISIYADALQSVIGENPEDSFYKDMWAYFVRHNDKYPDFYKNYPREI
nr:ABC transporter substrate-binding protein [Treponema sp.]